MFNITFNSALMKRLFEAVRVEFIDRDGAEGRPAACPSIEDSKPHGAPTPRIKRGRWRWPLELSGRTKSLIGLVAMSFQHSFMRAFRCLLNQFPVPSLLKHWQKRPLLRSASERTDRPRRPATKKATKSPSGKSHRKAKAPTEDVCTWFCIDQLVAQGNIRSGISREGRLGCRGTMEVDWIDCFIDTTDPSQSYIRLSYLVKNLQTGEQRPVEHRVELARVNGRWWFVDEGRCCDELCLPPGGDRFRHREAHGVKSSVQRNASAKPVHRPPRGASVARRAPETAEQGLAGQVKKAAKRVTGIWKYAVSRTAIPSLMRSLIGQFCLAPSNTAGVLEPSSSEHAGRAIVMTLTTRTE